MSAPRSCYFFIFSKCLGDHSCKIAENTWCHDYKMVTEEENVEKLDILSHDNKVCQVMTATFTVHL